MSSGRAEKSAVVGRAKEIATKEEADALRGLKLYIPRDTLPQPDEDEFYLTDLVGLEARDPDGLVRGGRGRLQDRECGDRCAATCTQGQAGLRRLRVPPAARAVLCAAEVV